MADNINDNDGVDDLVIDRSHIECDWCGKPGPTKNCSRCSSYYYCNRGCQVNHWKEHKEFCSLLKRQCDLHKEKLQVWDDFDQEDKDKKAKEECAICLEEIELPIYLECGHVFCVSCLMQYHSSNPKKSSCPNCRGHMNQLGAISGQQAFVYTERARRSEGAEKEMYAKLALQQIDDTLNQSLSEDQEAKNILQIYSLVTKTTLYGELNMPREVIETVNKIMDLCANTEYDIDKEMVLDVKISNAKAHLGLEEWQTALDMFKLLYEDCKEGHPGLCYGIAAGISRAQYELQNYHEAIIEGERAVCQNRNYAGVHKYIALSQMKLGDIAEAKKSITRGILHEEQWDEENRKKNEEVLGMILAKEETQNTKSKSTTKKKGMKKNSGKK